MINSLSDSQKGILGAVTTATCWSCLALFLKYALIYSDSYSIVWYRMTVSFTVLAIWHIFSGRSRELHVLTSRPGLLLVAAFALSFNYVGFMQGVHYTSPASAQIFIQLGPLLLALSGLFFFKEKLSRKQMTGMCICTLGFGLFFSDRLSLAVKSDSTFYLGLSWILMAAVTWALFASLQKTLLTRWKSSQINIYIYLVASLVYLPKVDWASLGHLSPELHLFYVFLGLNTILAYGSLSIALKYLPATQVSPIITMNPLLTLVLINIIAWLDWDIIPADPIGWKGYLGAICAIAGVIFVLARKAPTKVVPLKGSA